MYKHLEINGIRDHCYTEFFFFVPFIAFKIKTGKIIKPMLLRLS